VCRYGCEFVGVQDRPSVRCRVCRYGCVFVGVQDRPSVRTTDRSLKIAKELSELVVYCQPVSFDWDDGRFNYLV